MDVRETLERLEAETLCEYAAKAGASRGRRVEIEPCEIRTDFMRDRDRIIHSKAFRRLKHKTQVFISPTGDHYRTRLTHTLEVSQIARTLARALRLNEDLTEAIALGHDLGHTPFGHSGERALDGLVGFHFEHNRQSLRVVETLEDLNLTAEVRDGIRNHRGEDMPFTLEGQCVRLADRIAYINHDIDDALRAGELAEADIPIDVREVLGETHGGRIGRLVGDIVAQGISQNKLSMSDEIAGAMKSLRDFMFSRIYKNERAMREERRVVSMLSCLFGYFSDNPDELPDDLWLIACGEGIERAVCDYIAGMTDPYAMEVFKERFVPTSWQNV